MRYYSCDGLDESSAYHIYDYSILSYFIERPLYVKDYCTCCPLCSIFDLPLRIIWTFVERPNSTFLLIWYDLLLFFFGYWSQTNILPFSGIRWVYWYRIFNEFLILPAFRILIEIAEPLWQTRIQCLLKWVIRFYHRHLVYIFFIKGIFQNFRASRDPLFSYKEHFWNKVIFCKHLTIC